MSPGFSLDRIAALRHRKARDESGMYFAAGVRFLVSAVDSGASIECVVTAPRTLKSPVGQMLVRRLRSRGVPELRVSPEDLEQLSTSREPQGVGVVVRQRWERLQDVCAEHGALWLALEHVQSAGNLGTLLRTGEASGSSGLIALGPTVDPFEPNSVRASMGALFTRRLVRATPSELAAWAQAQKLFVVGATADAPHDFRMLAYTRPTVIVLGSERKGLSPHVRRTCEGLVRIPMLGRTDSLNLAVAGSLLLYEAFAQRHPVRR